MELAGADKRLTQVGAYRIGEVLGSGGMGVVYRATHADTGEQVALKTVRAPHGGEVVGIRSEILALKRLRHPGIVRILDEGIIEGVPWYAMELLAGQTLAQHLRALWRTLSASGSQSDSAPSDETASVARSDETASMSVLPAAAPLAGPVTPSPVVDSGGVLQRLPEVLGLFRRLCAPLAYLHANGVIHRDLKPANVFLRSDGRVTLMDFGLVSRFEGAVGRESLDVAGIFAGTAAYVSPEQIHRQPLDARTDLYALGCMLYEAVTGRRPFVAGSTEALLEMHLSATPLPPSQLVEGLPAALEELILRLLAKHRRDRLGHAGDVAAVLASLGAQAPEQEEPEARLSHLYRPELSGREEVLARFEGWVESARKGRGQGLLVRGESGVGKTFLVSEVARLALQRGLRVVTGECVPVRVTDSAGLDVRGAPLHPLRPLLQAIGDCCRERGRSRTDAILGPLGKVLAAYEPSLRALPGQDAYPEPPRVDAEAANRRLLEALATTLAAFVAQVGPLVLVLDDLQWADELSLKFLLSLSDDYLSSRGLLLIGTYRSDEVGPGLAQLLSRPAFSQVALGRLDEATVGRMVSEMLALPQAQEALVRFLARQSEGNPFFVAEYLRTAVDEGLLYREAGAWRVAAGALTRENLAALPLPGSVKELVARRLANLSPSTRALAEQASVLGRESFAPVLTLASGLSEEAVLDGLKELVSRQVLEPAGEPGYYRFGHDKLRESTYQGLSGERRRTLHGQAAAALEKHQASSEGLGGMLYGTLAYHWSQAEVWPKAIDYLEKAGDQALENSSNREAVLFFTQALVLEEKLAERVRPSRLAHWERALLVAYFELGQPDKGTEHAYRALRHCGLGFPSSNAGWALGTLNQVLRCALSRYLPQRKPSAEQAVLMGNAAAVYQRFIERHMLDNQPLRAVYCGLHSINLAEPLPPSGTLARSYSFMTAVVGVTPLQNVARAWMQRTLAMAEALGQDSVHGYCLSRIATYASQRALWKETREWTQRSVELAQRSRDLRNLEDSLSIQSGTLHIEGYFQESLPPAREQFALARERGDTQTQTWARINIARALARLGREEEAFALFEESRPYLEKGASNGEAVWAYGGWALAHLRHGEQVLAREFALRALRLMREQRPAAYFCGPSVGDTAEVLTLLREAHPGDRELARQAHEACGFLEGYSKLILFTQPYALLWRGVNTWLDGKPERARQLWSQALARAQELRMPYYEAKVLLEMGRHASGPEREELLRRANALFVRHETPRDITRVQDELAAKAA
jgi:serine/threonine protein kinase/tetratricopeptide (TPR) repeat protein